MTGELRGPALRVLLGCLVCQLGLGCSYFFGAVLKHVVSEFEWSRAAYAGGNATLLFGYAVAAPALGALTERAGARRVLAGAALLLGACFALFSRMQSLGEFHLACFALGVALTGLGDIPVGAVASAWAARGRGLALGLVYTGSNLGGAVVPVLAVAIAERSSWRQALLLVGALAVVVILPAALGLVREAPGRGRPGRGAAEARRDVAGAPPGAAADGPASLGLAAALRTRSFWILGWVLLVFYFYYVAVTLHLVAFLSDLGFSDAKAAASLGGAVLLGVVGKLGMGVLADRVAWRLALLANFAVVAAASGLLLAVDAASVLPIFLLTHGVAVAAENVILPLAVVGCFGVRHLARIYGALMVALLPGGALGPLFAGAVFDRVGDYRPAFACCAVLNVLALATLLFVRCETGEAEGQGMARAAA
jgi:sugar phosphate permease